MAEVYNRPVAAPGGARSAGAIDQGLRSFMLGTYNYMALGVAGTAAVVMALVANPDVLRAVAMGPMKWVLFAGIFGLGMFAQKRSIPAAQSSLTALTGCIARCGAR